MTAILVTGSRDWTDRDLIARTLPNHPTGTILLHGNCGENERLFDNLTRPLRAIRGADLFARDVARSRGWVAIPFPYFGWLGAGGGPHRNQAMVESLVALLAEGHTIEAYAFPIATSRGTWDCINKMRAAGIVPVITRGA